MKNNTWFKLLGPGILFAAAAIGVSHLVQATRAGAEYGMGLLWAVFIVHLFKYPFFQFGPRYAMATGESLLHGIKRLGTWVLVLYFLLTILTMFIIQSAVGLVTAGIAQYVFGFWDDIFIWMVIGTVSSALVLVIGRYKVLDILMKLVVVLLTLCTIVAVVIALKTNYDNLSFEQVLPHNMEGIIFLIALMGWMPAPLDVIIWQSLWSVEKSKTTKSYHTKQAIIDFNVGYGFTIILAISFLLLGAMVMFNSGEQFSGSAIQFSKQLVNLYSSQLGPASKIFISIAAFATMFSTSITTLDASSRVMDKTVKLLFPHREKSDYLIWLAILVIGTMIIIRFFVSEMGLMVKIATVFSFLTAPFFAIVILILVKSKYMSKEWQPGKWLTYYAIAGIIFLLGFSGMYVYSLI